VVAIDVGDDVEMPSCAPEHRNVDVSGRLNLEHVDFVRLEEQPAGVDVVADIHRGSVHRHVA